MPQHILITGASSGIGEALARHYAAPGVALALTGRDAARLAAVAAACRGQRAVVEEATVDVTDRQGMHDWIEGIDRARPLDLVIANAGISTGRGREEDGETMRQVFAVNVDGVLNTVLPAIPLLRARRRGQIALMGSLAGFRGLPSATAYSASKAAVKSLGESWRLLLERDGIGVSVICPGFVTTRMTARNKVRMPFLMPAERAASIIATGLARNRPRIAFPFPTAAVSWLMEALPAGWSDALARRAGV